MANLLLIQARMASTRLPGKVLIRIGGLPIIEIIYNRLKKCQKVDEIVVATTTSKLDDKLCDFLKNKNIPVFRGPENNVLDRFQLAAKKYNASAIIRITADCPLADAGLIDAGIEKFHSEAFDYLSNTIVPTFPDGLDFEIFSREALNNAARYAETSFEKEHVTPYIKNHKKFKKFNLESTTKFSHLRLTVDEPEDILLFQNLFKIYKFPSDVGWEDVCKIYKKNPNIFNINAKFLRDEGANMNKGEKLYKRAKRLIPGGTNLLSKKPEMFLNKNWPCYFQKSKGCKVWDLDENEYIDMCLMGVGTNILGYSNDEVNTAVIEAIKEGTMTTLNSAEEVYLAEKLIKMHPWAGMVRYAKTGGEANTIALRIARSFSKKDKVAFCGYHGWHDWYLSSNLQTPESLSEHLLSGLSTTGVPKSMAGCSLPFSYNKVDELHSLLKENEIGAIIMEVSRNHKPQNNFLNAVSELAKTYKVPLIFDECTSGFRETFGGLHLKYEIEPDLCVFGKAISNGFPLTCIIGKEHVMSEAQDSFISSTFWTDRTGYVAALKTLEIMEKLKSWKLISKKGQKIKEKWKQLAQYYEISINVMALDALATFKFNSNFNQEYKTFLTQELLKGGFLARDSIYTSIAHEDTFVESYFSCLEPVFEKIRECEKGKDINLYLDNGPSKSGFQRLN